MPDGLAHLGHAHRGECLGGEIVGVELVAEGDALPAHLSEPIEADPIVRALAVGCDPQPVEQLGRIGGDLQSVARRDGHPRKLADARNIPRPSGYTPVVRVALLYPPPWKIAPREGLPYPKGEGPPEGFKDGDLDADFFQIPYGLLALGACAIRAGHQVKVMNLSSFVWPKVEEVVLGLEADVYAMSCWTANRRGVKLVADEIKRVHPKAHVIVGGPHATPLGPELLRHYTSVDTVCTGESDVTFLEVHDRVARGETR